MQKGEEKRGALVLVDQWQVSFPDGIFDPVAMIATRVRLLSTH
ncbi:hypothetical protein [Nitrosococcus wardiae]|nr:hypothetical protein [Nitrosococcus wardiae]